MILAIIDRMMDRLKDRLIVWWMTEFLWFFDVDALSVGARENEGYGREHEGFYKSSHENSMRTWKLAGFVISTTQLVTSGKRPYLSGIAPFLVDR
jgi:hypothetical protein